jgi:hypothetical protein
MNPEQRKTGRSRDTASQAQINPMLGDNFQHRVTVAPTTPSDHHQSF